MLPSLKYYNKYGGPKLKQINTFKAKTNKQTNTNNNTFQIQNSSG